MGERARLFEDGNDFDVAGFAPKQPGASNAAMPPTEDVRAVSEASNFPSREARVTTGLEKRERTATPKPEKREPMRYRTGRNIQFNVKLRAETTESLYGLAKQHGWTLGETIERALRALKTELGS